MRRYAPALAALLLLGSGPAWSHAHLQASSPADHSTLAQAPDHLALRFNEPVHLTALGLQAGGAAAAAREFSVPLPALAPGTYTVSWRAASDDGHIMSGTLTFTLR